MFKAGNPPKEEMNAKRIHFTDNTSHKREDEKCAFSILCNPVSFELCEAQFSFCILCHQSTVIPC